jgi:hypothetical protein
VLLQVPMHSKCALCLSATKIVDIVLPKTAIAIAAGRKLTGASDEMTSFEHFEQIEL